MDNTRALKALAEQLEERLLLSANLVEWNVGGAVDSFGDSVTYATPLTINDDGTGLVQGLISSSSDVDVLQLTSHQTGHMQINMAPLGTENPLLPQLIVRDSQGNIVAQNDAQASSSEALLRVNVQAGNTYFIEARSQDGTAGYYQIGLTTEINSAPTASFHADNNTVIEGQEVRFDASSSADVDQDIQSYLWDFGDGNTGSGATAAHLFETPGQYTVTLTVTDEHGASSTALATITVEPDMTVTPGIEWTPADVGSVAKSGNTSYVDGVYTLEGSGADIWGTNDEFHFAYQTIEGNGEIIARVTGVENTNSWAKAGVMIRDSLASNSTHAFVAVSAGRGVAFQRRTWTGGDTRHTSGPNASHQWVRLVREGATLTAYSSADGASWVKIGASTVSMDSQVYVGLAVTSHNDGVLCTSTFDNVTFSGAKNNQIPQAEFTVSANQIEAGQAVHFDASSSTDPDGDSLSYMWDFGEGMVVKGLTASHTYTTPGTYTAVLTVDDGNGGSAYFTTQIVVIEPNVAPAASIITDVLEGDAPLTVGFNALASSDADGDSLSYAWDFGDGVTATGAVVQHVFQQPGQYTVTLTVDDGRGGVDVATTVITVAQPNRTPEASVSADVTEGDGPLTVTFDGAASTDPDGDILNCIWDFGDGTTATGATATHIFETPGEYVVSLTVDDGRGLSSTSTITILVHQANRAPVASIVADVTEGDGPLTVTFDSSTSTDADGDFLNCVWDFGDGTTASGDTVTHVFETPGEYVVSLTVDDGRGLSSTSTITILVHQANRTPVASIVADVTEGDGPLTVTFDGAASSDADGDILNCVWDFGDGTTATGATATHIFETPGEYVVSLTVDDGRGLSSTSTITILVHQANRAPVAVISASTTEGEGPLEVLFDASGSSDPDGDGLSYLWDFGDGQTAQGVSATHVFDGAGSYTVTLTVSDGRGQSSTVLSQIIVNEPQDSASWLQTDVGAVAATGSTTVGDGLLTMEGSGADIWGKADEFHFAYQVLQGDGEIIARIASVENTNSWAKAGVMVRDSLSANSTHALVAVTSGNGVAFQRRTWTGGDTTHTSGSNASHKWVRLVRSGNTLTAYSSADGNSWTRIGSDTVAMSGEVYIGLAVTSHNDGILCTAVADNIFATGMTPNSVPQAGNDLAVTDEDSPVDIDVLANDRDGDGDILSVESYTQPANGSVTFNTDGTLRYTPDANFYGSDSFTYRVSDGNGGVTTATIELNVLAVADSPLAENDSATVLQGNSVQIDLLANDSDPDGDLLSIASVGQPLHGSVVANGDGTVTYTPESGYVGNDMFDYFIDDGTGRRVSALVTVTVNDSSDPVDPGEGGGTNGSWNELGSIYYIDRDGDGYGVASPLGPDADDTDASVITWEDGASKYGGFEAFLNHLGYQPERVIFVATYGSNTTGEVGNIDKPFATYGGAPGGVQAGDVVIYREGTWKSKYCWGISNLHGTVDKPIVFMAMPGERVSFDGNGHSMSIESSSNIVLDGFLADNTNAPEGTGISIHYSENVMIRNIESKGHKWGMKGSQGLVNVVTEYSVYHDNPIEHGIYWAARENPNTGTVIRNCLFYRNGRHGFQQNGRVSGMVIEGNIIHSNNLGGLSLINGFANSVIRDNLIFNNNKQGIIFYTYDETHVNIYAYAQNNNLIENNTIWVGAYSWNGKYNPQWHPAILFNDTSADNVDMTGNVFRDNTIVTYSSTVFEFRQAKYLDSTVIENNRIWRMQGDWNVLNYAGTSYSFSDLESFSTLISDNIWGDPNFADVSIDYYLYPEWFDFNLLG